ncbi:hypothetical protein cypCar_00002716 [Cyprinus carpio]|nr:hypothetical protein cypCar_00002716 [Cyprinus carpio]
MLISAVLLSLSMAYGETIAPVEAWICPNDMLRTSCRKPVPERQRKFMDRRIVYEAKSQRHQDRIMARNHHGIE